MTQIQTNIDEFVSKVKHDKRLSGYRFIKGFCARQNQNPLYEDVIAVSVMDTQQCTNFVGSCAKDSVKGSVFDLSVKFRIYARKSAGGDGLSTLAFTLCDVIRDCDNQSCIKDVAVTGIAFDENARTVYRDVVAEFSFCLCEEVAL